MTPGFAKTRSELPWLYYPKANRVLINAHNFPPAGPPWPSLQDAVAGYYARNDGGAAATDQFGAVDGTLTNGATRVDDEGLTYSFDGTNDFIALGTDNVFNFGHDTPFTISAWIKSTQTTNNTHSIISRWSGTPTFKGWFFATHNSGVLYFQLQQSLAVYKYAYGSVNVADGAWHNVIAVNDGSGTLAGMKIYIDGTEDTGGSPAQAGTMTNITLSTDANIGIRDTTFGSDTGAVPFNGKIDDLLILDRVPTVAEIGYLSSQRGAAY